MAKRPPGLFITGTDTGVGKTFVTSSIARMLVAEGLRVGVYKPVLSGCSVDPTSVSVDELGACPDDDLRIWKAAGAPGELTRVCPQRFRAPLAPHLAARIEAREVDSALLRSGVEYWRNRSDIVLVEGAGGLMSPVTDHEFIADLALDVGYPLVVVTRNTLGVINQTMQTVMTAAAYRDGIAVAAVVLNHLPEKISPADASQATNYDELRTRCHVPVVALLQNASEFEPRVDWLKLASV